MSRTCCLLLLFALLPARLHSQAGWWAFTLPWDDASRAAIDASDLLVDYPGQDPATVIDARGRLRAGPGGHFYFEKTGRRARFFGVNFTFNANFPPCPDVPRRAGEYFDDRVSDKVARRLAKLGVNVVRFHHMDYYAAPNGIWDPAYFPNDTQHLDEGQLRRFDYLVYQLRRNGIYTNINLKVARHFGVGDGVAEAAQFTGSLSFYQGVSHFNPRMVELQKEYARTLLGHRNPYTGLTYAEDPAVAFVEVANEDSMFGNMLRDGGLNHIPGTSGTLPESYSRELDVLWNSWLVRKYASRSPLEQAWRSGDAVGDPSDRMRNGGFESGLAEWTVQQLEDARASSRVEGAAGPDGSSALRVEVTSDGTNWHVQAMQSGHAIVKDKTYEIRFFARAAAAADIGVDVMRGAPDWRNYGLSKTVRLSTSWQQFAFRFKANETDPGSVRPTFELGAQSTTIWLDKVEFRESAAKGLLENEDPSAGTVGRPVRSELGEYTDSRVVDLFRFYAEIDEAYFGGMYRTIKDEIGCRAMVTGTAAWWAFLGDAAVQSKTDYIDTHYYWDHPSWPGVPAWSSTGWRINNTPWINSLGDFGGIPQLAVEGKPLTLSEFNYVFPNRYALEGPLLAALIANLQDWDAVYMFDYAGSTAAFDDEYTTSFFSLAGNPVKSAQLPVVSRILLGGQNAPAPELLPIELARDELALGFARGLESARRFLAAKGLPETGYLKARLRIRTFDRPRPADIAYRVPEGDIVSGGGELLWTRSAAAGSAMRVEASAVQGAIGFIKGARHDFGSWGFEVSPDSPEHLAVLLQSRDGVPLRESRRMILSVWTEHQNTGMVWNSARTSVENNWGRAPTLLRRAQLAARFRLPGARTMRIVPLDEKGNQKAPLESHADGGYTSFDIDTERDACVWYALEINTPASAADFTIAEPGVTQMYTDASAGDLQVGWSEIENRSDSPLRLTSLLEYRSRGVLTSAVRLPASPPVLRALAPVLRSAAVDTAVALLNRGSGEITIALRLLDSAGVPRAPDRAETLKPGESRAFFVRERFEVAEAFEGLLELHSGMPFHAITLRSIYTAAGDFALTPYPTEPAAPGPLYFAHLVSDAEYSSDLVLWNSLQEPVACRLEFFDAGGEPRPAGPNPPSADILLHPGQLRRIGIPASAASPFHGYARLTRASGPYLPTATAVITRWENGGPVSEAGIPATPELTEERLVLVERPLQKTGLALLNPGAVPATVDLALSGTERPLSGPAGATVTLQPGEKRAFFLYQVFAELPQYLTCSLSIRSPVGIAALALLGLTNERNNFLLASLTGDPGVPSLPGGALSVLPRIATGSGYRTILFLQREGDDAASARARFFDASGIALPLLFR